MPSTSVAVFWLSLVFVLYAYVGYPAALLVWSRLRRRPVRREAFEPTVTLIVAAHNEADTLEAKIRNCRALEYPCAKLKIIVALDGCTDGTAARVDRLAGPDLEVVCLPERRGKAVALNAALARATHEVVVFADARQRIEPGALQALLAPLADPEVGVVTGELVLTDGRGKESGAGAGLYWRYEKKVRALESEVHSVIGATGALYAARRDEIEPLPEGTLIDDVLIPMRIVLAGKRCVFEPRARVFDRVPCCADVEYRRKVRTLAGNFQLLVLMPQLLMPRRNPVWLQFVSHKVARLLVPYALVTLLVSNIVVASSHALYGTFLMLQAVFYALAVLGDSLAADEVPAGALRKA
jgi:biofilm PGA synthesis N-glycosyltransferase PgaC